MRILDNRYSRDLRRHDLALRMIRHELRTATIIAWTGLSETRIRGLYRSYIPESGLAALRHRGPPPTSVQLLLRSRALNAEAAGLAGICVAIGVLPAKPMKDPARELPSLLTGERLCYAFELYQQLVPKPQITLEQLVLLVSALVRQEEVKLVHCATCDGAMLMTLLRKPHRVCPHCVQRSEALLDPGGAQRKPVEGEDAQESAGDPLGDPQRRLF
jgi:hypothetical protein